MPKAATAIDLGRAVRYAFSARRTCRPNVALLPSSMRFIGQILVGEMQEYALVNIAVQRCLTDRSLEGQRLDADFAKHGLGRIMLPEYFLLDILGLLVIPADLQIRTLRLKVDAVFFMSNIRAVPFLCRVVAVQMGIPSSFQLPVDRRAVNPKRLCDFCRAIVCFAHSFYAQAVGERQMPKMARGACGHFFNFLRMSEASNSIRWPSGNS